MPDRRLISGLLYINVINHNENDDKDDFIQQCNDHATSGSDKIKYSDAFVDPSGTWDAWKDRGRTNMKHSFADYDCFVFHVAGGMSLSGGIMGPTSANTVYNSEAALVLAGYVNGISGNWIVDDTDGTGNYAKNWTKLDDNSGDNPFGDACSHFIKYHLVSRINNASGHSLNAVTGTNPLFYKSRPIHRQTYHTSSAAVSNIADPATVSNEYVLSHGIYDDKDTQGTSLTTNYVATDGAGGSGFYRIESSIRTAGETAGGGNDDGNTYYSPVDTIKIYGKHRLIFESHAHPSDGSVVWSHSSLNAAHVTTWWDLVIDIGLRGNNPNATSVQSVVSTKSVMRPQINVSFQPFGETADFSIADTEHTS